MIAYALLSLIVGCYGIQWSKINDFKETFKEYSVAAVDTISSIESVLDNSEKESLLFLNNTYSKNPKVNWVTRLKSSDDKCFANFIDEENFKFSFQIQLYQLQIPLQYRIVDIRERLNYVNSSIDIYQRIAESKYRSCKSESESCLEETKQWLESGVDSLLCAIHPNCSNHSIRKREVDPSNNFKCQSGGLIRGNYFCDGECDCRGNCDDEPSGCTRQCTQFRCRETFRCISSTKKCNGNDDCGDGSDEEGCPPPTTTPPSYTHVNCSIDAGDFLCGPDKCIGLERVCDGYNDCGDWADELDGCKSRQCSPECGSKGGVCFTDPEGSKCLYECPPGTYETSGGCSRNPEAPLPTLLQVLEDTPRLMARYGARLKFLKTKTIIALSKALREVVRCKREEFSLLSNIINFSTIIHEEKKLLNDEHAVPPVAVDVTDANIQTTSEVLGLEVASPTTEEPFTSDLYSDVV